MTQLMERRQLLGAAGIVWSLVVSAALISQYVAQNQSASQFDVQALQERLAQLEIPVTLPPAASPADLRALQQTLEARVAVIAKTVEQRAPWQALRELEQQVQRLESLPPAPVAAVVEAKPQSAPKPLPRKPIPPPFQIIGVELRGGERFLAVTPRNAKTLEQTQLLRVGETRQGWILETLEASSAVFRVDRTVRRLPLP